VASHYNTASRQGDNRTVKFWDVRDAMRGANQLPGGWIRFAHSSTKKTTPASQKFLILDRENGQNDPNTKFAGFALSFSS
jgi:hypothetical protein